MPAHARQELAYLMGADYSLQQSGLALAGGGARKEPHDRMRAGDVNYL